MLLFLELVASPESKRPIRVRQDTFCVRSEFQEPRPSGPPPPKVRSATDRRHKQRQSTHRTQMHGSYCMLHKTKNQHNGKALSDAGSGPSSLNVPFCRAMPSSVKCDASYDVSRTSLSETTQDDPDIVPPGHARAHANAGNVVN